MAGQHGVHGYALSVVALGPRRGLEPAPTKLQLMVDLTVLAPVKKPGPVLDPPALLMEFGLHGAPIAPAPSAVAPAYRRELKHALPQLRLMVGQAAWDLMRKPDHVLNITVQVSIYCYVLSFSSGQTL